MAIGVPGNPIYDESMFYCKLFRKWPIPCALAGIALLAVLAGLLFRSPRVAAVSVEVVNSRPIHAVHAAGPARQETLLAGTGRARVEIPQDFYDFGPVAAQEVVRRDFLVINRGSADLVISQAYTTCGCTTAEISASVIPPGKASRVTVTFDAGFHAITRPSAVRRGVVLETNDPNHPEIEIWIQASLGQ